MSITINVLSVILAIGFVAYLILRLSHHLIDISDPVKDPQYLCQIPQKGKVAIVVHGGRAIKYIGDPGNEYSLDPKTGKIDPITPTVQKHEDDFIDWFLRGTMGLTWIGWNGSILKEDFSFDEEYDGKIKRRTVNTPYVKIQHPYVTTLSGLETLDQHHIEMILQCVFRVTDVATLRLVIGRNWLDAVFGGAVGSAVREFSANTPYRDVLKEKTESENSLLRKTIMALNENTVGNPPLTATYGLEIISVNILDIKNMNKEMQEATEQEALAKERGNAKIADAKRNADTLEIETEAKAKAMNRMAEAKANEVKLPGMAQVEVDKARVEAYKGNPPEVAWPKAIAETKGTFFVDSKAVPFFNIQPNNDKK